MDRSDINRWAKIFTETLYSAGRVSALMEFAQLYTEGKFPSGVDGVVIYVIEAVKEVSEKMDAFPLDQLEAINWELLYPPHLRNSLSLEEKVIFDNFELVVQAVKKFPQLRKTVYKWKGLDAPERLVEAPVTSRRLITG